MHRVVQVPFLPHSAKSWDCYTEARQEAARLWGDLVLRHHRIRRLRWKWPSTAKWFTWAKGKYPKLHSQSVQQIIYEFYEAVTSIAALRRAGHSEARYPWRKPKYRDILYSNQAPKLRNGYLILPNGKSGDLVVKLPKGFHPEGRLMEARLKYGKILLTYKLVDLASSQEPVQLGIDLGVNTLIAATDGEKAVLISGREAKATIQWRNKRLATIQAAQARKERGSRRRRRLQKRKYRLLDKAANRIKDLVHKATRKIVVAFPNAQAFVGEPFNDAARRLPAKQAQQVSQACTRRVINQLDYKLRGGAITVSEAYSSQTCPVCGCRTKCRRVYKCKQCGFTAPRDVVGAVNIRSIGRTGGLKPQGVADLTPRVAWVHAAKYPGRSQVVPEDPWQVARLLPQE